MKSLYLPFVSIYSPPGVSYSFNHVPVLPQKKVSKVKPNQDAIMTWPPFGSLDGDASRTKQFENIQTNAVQDGDLFKQYKNKQEVDIGGITKKSPPMMFHTQVTPYNPVKMRFFKLVSRPV